MAERYEFTFLFSLKSTLVPGPTQSSSGRDLSQSVRAPEREAHRSTPSSAEVLYLHSLHVFMVRGPTKLRDFPSENRDSKGTDNEFSFVFSPLGLHWEGAKRKQDEGKREKPRKCRRDAEGS
jgi:hypothetical protein